MIGIISFFQKQSTLQSGIVPDAVYILESSVGDVDLTLSLILKESTLRGAQMKPTTQKETPFTSRRSGRLTQWAAQFAVASELCKRGYEVSFTMGNNTPIADLMVASPIRHEHFLIDVKGLYKKNPWVVSRKEVRANLFYVLAFVPTNGPNEFFVMSQDQINHYIKTELDRLGRDADYPMSGILWRMALAHRDDWGILPQ